ncbi:MAG TPA: DUF72 domain-containing protein [Mycobacterium sp.]|nr:DUF72 domain-containing protein [Mycobacterium sp.]
MTVRIGTSGWSYDHWAGVLYPPKLPAARRLRHYVEEFDTVELNASFYRWPKDSTFLKWRTELPDGFAMSVKAHRGLTHYRRLNAPEPWIERFERCWQLLDGRRGAVLVQLHPEQARDDRRLDAFLAGVPQHIRIAMELRHPSWDAPGVYALLEKHHAAYVVTSGAGMRCVPAATSDLVYVRLHGPASEDLYSGSYSREDLEEWAAQIIKWDSESRDVLVYFNNDLNGNAVRNGRVLLGMLPAGVTGTGKSTDRSNHG